MSGALDALARALSLAGVPRLVVRELPPPNNREVPAASESGDSADIVAGGLLSPPSPVVPSLAELVEADGHEVSVRRGRARRKRAVDSASKLRRSDRLAAKEIPYYMNATTKATRVKTAKLDLSRASAKLKEAMADAQVLERPPPARIRASKLRCMGRVCGLAGLGTVVDDDEVLVAPI